MSTHSVVDRGLSLIASCSEFGSVSASATLGHVHGPGGSG